MLFVHVMSDNKKKTTGKKTGEDLHRMKIRWRAFLVKQEKRVCSRFMCDKNDEEEVQSAEELIRD